MKSVAVRNRSHSRCADCRGASATSCHFECSSLSARAVAARSEVLPLSSSLLSEATIASAIAIRLLLLLRVGEPAPLVHFAEFAHARRDGCLHLAQPRRRGLDVRFARGFRPRRRFRDLVQRRADVAHQPFAFAQVIVSASAARARVRLSRCSRATNSCCALAAASCLARVLRGRRRWSTAARRSSSSGPGRAARRGWR